MNHLPPQIQAVTDVPHQAIPAYILAGGRSTRFGSDKARACYRSEPLILRQARLLESLGHSVTVVARHAGQYQDLGLPTIADLEPDQGPACGVITALRHRGNGWLILSSCDLVILKPEWLDALIAVALRENTAAVAYRSDRWQPFPGLYHTRLLQQPETWRKPSLQHALNTAPASPLPFPRNWPQMVQANTPDDLLALEYVDGSHAGRTETANTHHAYVLTRPAAFL